MAPYVVEFLGTLLLIATIAFSGNPALIVAAFAFAVGLGGKISGGHFNPAVSTWAWFSGKLTTPDYSMYVLAQLGAGVLVWVMASMT